MYMKKNVFGYLLAKKGITKKKACEELKLSVNTVNNWLHRNVKTTVGKAMYISEYFNVELEELFDLA